MIHTTQAEYHKSVLTQEVLEHMCLKPGGIYVDATFGGGGHTRAILEHEPTCKVIAFDWDQTAFDIQGKPLKEKCGDRLILIKSNFINIQEQLYALGIEQVDGILADFGTSQYQIHKQPGFSFAQDTQLDMRMSLDCQKETAAHILNKYSEKDLAYIFWFFGQEVRSRKIAKYIVQERIRNPFCTTAQLAALVEHVIPGRGKRTHPATKVFQALRIYVNKELENIELFLPRAISLLKSGGRLACITFHSLEDRLVKHFFKQESREHGRLRIITPKGVVASSQELAENKSARSARLRVIERNI